MDTDRVLTAGSVLCVRWAHHGRYLASGSDDFVIMLWGIDTCVATISRGAGLPPAGTRQRCDVQAGSADKQGRRRKGVRLERGERGELETVEASGGAYSGLADALSRTATS